MTCEEFDEVRDLYALGALLPDEEEEAEEHLANCAICQEKAAESWRVAQLLREAIPQVEPSAEVKRSLLAQVSASRPEPESMLVRFARAWPSLRWATAAAMPLVLAAWLGVQLNDTQHQLAANQKELQSIWETSQAATQVMAHAIAAGGKMVALQGTEMAPMASGRLYYMPGDPQAVLVVSGLPTLAEGQVYQLWLHKGDQQLNGGALQIEPDGRGMLVVNSGEPLYSYQDCIITSEPRGGSTSPLGKHYLWGRVAST
ncbi:MAG TPA: anti-sigma factor [Chloroflexota bacterium]